MTGLAAGIEACERAVWQALMAGDAAADRALIAYCAVNVRPGRKEEELMHVSSIWQSQALGWANVFSQDRPATGEMLP